MKDLFFLEGIGLGFRVFLRAIKNFLFPPFKSDSRCEGPQPRRGSDLGGGRREVGGGWPGV